MTKYELFVMIYYRTESLIVCIVTHGVFNALSIFVNEAAVTDTMQILSCLFLIVVCGGYAAYLAKGKNVRSERGD